MKKLRFGVVILVAFSLFSCDLQLDIKEFIINEVARDYKESEISFSVYAEADNKKFVPSLQPVTCTIPINNYYHLPLEATINFVRESDAEYFENFPKGKISCVDELEFDFTLKAEADATATSLGKEIPVRITLINPANLKENFGEKKLTIRCNTAPPKLPLVTLAIETTQDEFSLIFETPEASSLIKTHTDIQALCFYDVKKNSLIKRKVSVKSDGTFSLIEKGEIEAYQASAHKGILTDLPSDSPKRLKYDTSCKASVPERKVYEVYLLDSQGLMTTSSCATRLLKLLKPVLKDENGKIISEVDLSTTNEFILTYPKSGSNHILQVIPPNIAFDNEETETVTTDITLSYKTQGETASTDGTITPLTNGEITIGEGITKVEIYASSDIYYQSVATFRLTLQDEVHVNSSLGNENATYGFDKNTQFKTLEKALTRLETLSKVNPEIAYTLNVDGTFNMATSIDTLPANCTIKGTSTSTITATGVIEVTKALTLNGATFEGVRFEVANGGELTLTNTTIQNSHADQEEGGAINSSGTVILDNSTIKTCSAKNGGGIYNTGTLKLKGNSSVNECYACKVDNGGSYSDGYGGGIYNAGTLTMQDTAQIKDNGKKTAADSTTPKMDFTCDGIGVYNTGTFNFLGGTIDGNATSVFGGKGGGIYNSGTVNFSGGSIINNMVGYGGGIYTTGTVFMCGDAKIGGKDSNDERQTNKAAHGTVDSTGTPVFSGEGGGIYIAENGKVYLGYESETVTKDLTGEISENFAYTTGDGVYIAKGGMLMFSTGAIKNNAHSPLDSTTNKNNYYHEMYICQGANCTLSNSVYVATTDILNSGDEKKGILLEYKEGECASIKVNNFTQNTSGASGAHIATEISIDTTDTNVSITTPIIVVPEGQTLVENLFTVLSPRDHKISTDGMLVKP